MKELAGNIQTALLTILFLEALALLFRLRLLPGARQHQTQRNQILLFIGLLVFIGLKTFLPYGSWGWIITSFLLLASWGNFIHYAKHQRWGRIFNLSWFCLGAAIVLIYLFGFFPRLQLVSFFFIIFTCTAGVLLGLQIFYFKQTKTYLFLYFALAAGLSIIADASDFILFQVFTDGSLVIPSGEVVTLSGVAETFFGQIGYLSFACSVSLVVAWDFFLRIDLDTSIFFNSKSQNELVGGKTGGGGSKSDLRQVVSQLEQTEENLFQQDRLIALGYLAAGAAHEFKNVLNNLQLLLEYGLKQAAPDEKNKSFALIKENVQLASTSVTGLLESLAITGREEVKTISIAKFVHHLFKVFNSSFKKSRILFKSEVEKKLTLEMRESELKQIIINLVWNALQAFKRQQEKTEENFIFLKAYQQQQLVILDLADNAGGISEEVQGQLFTTGTVQILPGQPLSPSSIPAKPQPPSHCHKSGLGLYLAYQLTEKNNGQLEYIPLESGSCFRLTFPFSPTPVPKLARLVPKGNDDA